MLIFSDEINNILFSSQDNDIRIIFGIFGSKGARRIFCEVNKKFYKLHKISI